MLTKNSGKTNLLEAFFDIWNLLSWFWVLLLKTNAHPISKTGKSNKNQLPLTVHRAVFANLAKMTRKIVNFLIWSHFQFSSCHGICIYVPEGEKQMSSIFIVFLLAQPCMESIAVPTMRAAWYQKMYLQDVFFIIHQSWASDTFLCCVKWQHYNATMFQNFRDTLKYEMFAPSRSLSEAWTQNVMVLNMTGVHFSALKGQCHKNFVLTETVGF